MSNEIVNTEIIEKLDRNFVPVEHGFISSDEIKYIERQLNLKESDAKELKNLLKANNVYFEKKKESVRTGIDNSIANGVKPEKLWKELDRLIDLQSAVSTVIEMKIYA